MINKNKKIDSKLLIISSITIGGSLEWFQIGLLIFWPLLIEGMTPGFDVSVGESTNAVAILLLILSTFTSGATRALGAWIFGNEGDEKGRILAFTHTIYLYPFS
ncbi:MAG: hypothetical protein H6620_09325 [Halobacteriovoraceae bacterium]|nr:hypothetical protein [Halobacteriovoraceae bacterium]